MMKTHTASEMELGKVDVSARAVKPVSGERVPKHVAVPPSKISWSSNFPEYQPVEYTGEKVLANDSSKLRNGWADPEVVPPNELIKRRSYIGPILVSNPNANRYVSRIKTLNSR